MKETGLRMYCHGLWTKAWIGFLMLVSAAAVWAAPPVAITANPVHADPGMAPTHDCVGPTDSEQLRAIPWSEIGTAAEKQNNGVELSVAPTPEGAVLRCVFQRLEGEVTAEGLWLKSIVGNETGAQFRLKAAALGRMGMPVAELADSGRVEVEPALARWVRGKVVEEYSVGLDGVRQDFLVPERPGGNGDLRLVLALAGAKAEPAPDGARIILEDRGRRLAYTRLSVADASGKNLDARIEFADAEKFSIVVNDAGAVYPLRIDPTFSDEDWVSMGGLPGANNSVYAIAVDTNSGVVYVGGEFTIIGNVSANRIAKWDGSAWSPLGSGMNYTVRALALSGTDLYAGGWFTTAGGVGANRVAKWDGSAWSPLGSGLNYYVYALAVSGTDLYVGGDFSGTGDGVSANGIAKWDGSTWSAVGGGVDNIVYALTMVGPDLYVGGNFKTAGGVTVNYIAKWDGSAWSALGSGMSLRVFAIAKLGSDLYAGGYFWMAGGVSANNIAKWDGSAWSAVGGGRDGAVDALLVSGTNLYVGGVFGGNIAKWDGNTWSALGSGMGGGGVYALALAGTDLYAGGQFTTASGVGANRIAKWDGSAWSALGNSSGMNDLVYALALSGSDLYAGGNFTTAGGVNVNRIAKWDGDAWSALGGGVDNSIRALAVSGTDLYAGGLFTTAGGVNANYIAKWDGNAWSALGSGMSGYVYALALSGTDLYAGGTFTAAGGTSATNIAKWNGSTWSALGLGISNYVYALAASGTDLYAGGTFTMAGGTGANRVAKWDGSTWSALGSGMGGTVYALAMSGTDLYAGGAFTTAGGVGANRIAKWNGSMWSALGSGMGGTVYALAMSGTNLYSGGSFTAAGGVGATNIAKWDGSAWSALGSGMNNLVRALTVSETDLYAGGDFLVAGTNVSAYLARAVIEASSAPPAAPVSRAATEITATGFSANWSASAGATNYWLDVATDSEFTSHVSGYQNRAVGNVMTVPVTGLAAGHVYYYRVRAQNGAGISENSDVVTVTLDKADQTIDFPAIGDKVTTDIVELSATASSGLPVSFTVASGPGSLAGTELTFTGAGEVRIVATQAGDDNWNAAPEVPRTFIVAWATPVVAWGDNSYGQCDVPLDLTDAVAIAADGHNLALRADGTVVAWGDNSYGQCDIPEDLTDAVAVAAGTYHSLALREDGTVVAWGCLDPNNYYGYGPGYLPAGLRDVVAIAAGGMHALALRADGTVVAWGINLDSQCDVPAGLSDVVAIAARDNHSLALRADGTVVAWGNNDPGQSNVPEGLSNVVAIAAGYYHNMALQADGTAVAWGDDGYGQCDVPAGLSDVVAIAAGLDYSLALRADGTVAAWGDNENGGTDVPAGLSEVVAIAAGIDHNLALIRTIPGEEDELAPVIYGCEDRTVSASSVAGTAVRYMVRTRDNADPHPTMVFDPPSGSLLAPGDTPVTVTATDASGNASTCQFTVTVAIGVPAAAPAVVAWGANGYYQRHVPAELTNAVAIAASGSHSLALRPDGTVVAWGWNAVGQCDVPEGLSEVVAIAAGYYHNLAVRSDGTVVAWGADQFGQCDMPEGLTGVVAVAAGEYHNLALCSDGTVVAWGATYWAPVCDVPAGLNGVMAVAAGRHHSLALRTDGTVVGWGDNEYGQCSAPADLTNAVAIAAGWCHTLALRSDGTVVAWGNNGSGQCDVPTGLSDVVAITAGLLHSLALKSDGTVVAWGNNGSGECDVPGGLNGITAIAAGEYHSLALIGDKVPAAPVLSRTSVNVREAGEGRFFIRLDKEPESNVVVSISYSDGDAGLTVKSGGVRIFKPSNWSTWQAVVLAAGTDANADNETATFRMSAPGYEDTLVTATVLDDDIGENLALPASGNKLTGSKAYQLAQIVDGVHTSNANYGYTIWTSDPPGTMLLDLKRATQVTQVRLLNWDWTYRVNRYRLEASADGAVWTDLAEDAHETDRQGWDDWPVNGEPVRYVRFTGLSGSANQCVVLSELEVYGTPEPLPALAVSKTAVNVREAGEGRFFVRLPVAPAANVTVTVARSGGDTNLTVTGGAVRVFKPSNWDVWQTVVLAAGADANADSETATFQVSAPGYADTVVTATALDGELGENLARAAGTTVKGWRAMQVANAVDGVHTSSASYTYTIWTNVPPGMLTVDLKSLKNLTRVRLLTWDWTYRVNRYRLEASADGVNWTDLAPTAQTTDRQGWDNWPVTGEPVRYVRFTGLYSSANQCAALSELEIYGSAPARRSSGQVKETVAAASEPVSVLTSEGPEDETGWAAVDGDPETAWTGQKAGGGYLVVEYAPALTLRALEVDLAEGSLSKVEYLYSQDAEGWLPLPADLETNPVSLNFLWLVFPGNGTKALPEVKEIRLNY